VAVSPVRYLSTNSLFCSVLMSAGLGRMGGGGGGFEVCWRMRIPMHHCLTLSQSADARPRPHFMLQP
jgi:hypothetical protein